MGYLVLVLVLKYIFYELVLVLASEVLVLVLVLVLGCYVLVPIKNFLTVKVPASSSPVKHTVSRNTAPVTPSAAPNRPISVYQ